MTISVSTKWGSLLIASCFTDSKIFRDNLLKEGQCE